MGRWLRRGLVAAVCLGLALPLTLILGTRAGWPLERRISRLVETRRDDHFSFDGLVPRTDTGLTIGSPRYGRPGLSAGAGSVIVHPAWARMAAGDPAAERVEVVDGFLTSPTASLHDLRFLGSAPRLRGGLDLTGDLHALVAAPLVGDALAVLATHVELSTGRLAFTGLTLTMPDGALAGNVVVGMGPGATVVDLTVTPSDPPPAVVLRGLVVRPTGTLTAHAVLPEDGNLAGYVLHLPLAGLGARASTDGTTLGLAIDEGTLDVAAGRLDLPALSMVVGNGARVTARGSGRLVDAAGRPDLALDFTVDGLALASFLAGLPDGLHPALGDLRQRAAGRLEGVAVAVTGTPTDPRIDATFLATVPVADLPRAIRSGPDVALAGGLAALAARVTSRGGTAIATGTLSVPGHASLSVSGRDRPFALDAMDLAATWDLDPAAGTLTIPALGGRLAGGLLAARATLPLTSPGEGLRAEGSLDGVDLDYLLGRGAGIAGLIGGRLHVDVQTSPDPTASRGPTGRGSLVMEDFRVEGSRLVAFAGWNRYLPPPPSKQRNLGRALLSALAESVATRSSTGAALLTIRDVLHGTYSFGRVRAEAVLRNGTLTIAPLTAEGGPTTLTGRLTLDLADLGLDGLVSGRLVQGDAALRFEGIALRGTASEPRVELTRPFAETFTLEAATAPTPR